MTVKSILEGKGRDVVTLRPDATLGEATALLAKRRIGAIVLIDEAGAVVGIISERDIVRIIGTKGPDCLLERVSSVMTREVTICSEATSVYEAMEIMTERRFRHIPVCEDGKLVGLVSIGDVVKRRIEDVEREATEMRQYITAG